MKLLTTERNNMTTENLHNHLINDGYTYSEEQNHEYYIKNSIRITFDKYIRKHNVFIELLNYPKNLMVINDFDNIQLINILHNNDYSRIQKSVEFLESLYETPNN